MNTEEIIDILLGELGFEAHEEMGMLVIPVSSRKEVNKTNIEKLRNFFEKVGYKKSWSLVYMKGDDSNE